MGFFIAIPALLRRHRILPNRMRIRKQQAFILSGLILSMRLNSHARRPHSS
jgi:hypothetical protein